IPAAPLRAHVLNCHEWQQEQEVEKVRAHANPEAAVFEFVLALRVRIRRLIEQRNLGGFVGISLLFHYLPWITTVPASLSCQPCLRLSQPTHSRPRNKPSMDT